MSSKTLSNSDWCRDKCCKTNWCLAVEFTSSKNKSYLVNNVETFGASVIHFTVLVGQPIKLLMVIYERMTAMEVGPILRVAHGLIVGVSIIVLVISVGLGNSWQ